MPVPSNKCGLIIGKGGETIKNINSSCGVHCEVDKNAPPDARDKNFVIKGPAEGVARAKDMILEKLGQQSGYGGKATWLFYLCASDILAVSPGLDKWHKLCSILAQTVTNIVPFLKCCAIILSLF